MARLTSVVATDNAGYAAWTEVQSAEPCDAVNTYRTVVQKFRSAPPPDIAARCPPAFGNADLAGDVLPRRRANAVSR